MTPKEKAKQLYEKFEMIECGTDQDGEDWYLYEYCNPKQLALICIEEQKELLRRIGTKENKLEYDELFKVQGELIKL